jgi:hypothetical protein
MSEGFLWLQKMEEALGYNIPSPVHHQRNKSIIGKPYVSGFEWVM